MLPGCGLGWDVMFRSATCCASCRPSRRPALRLPLRPRDIIGAPHRTGPGVSASVHVPVPVRSV